MFLQTILHQVSRCFLAFFLVAVTTSIVPAQGDAPSLPVEELLVRSQSAELRFQVEVASNDIQRARGLMFREEMAEDHGMLFVFENEGERFFWMKNTPLPLDIIYISEAGRIVSIAAETVPFSENVIPSGHPARFVLELNAGLSEKLGITVGDTVSSSSMKVE
ncbi:MAG: DUF192 domain-containing protein [Roseibium sp.]|nr:DUF192 domain-containing protein [Roseibium sp.]MBO6929281.1 DUF192 domain-containing protein [Roseibium sp.]